jgi:hypothetical protein
MVEQLAEVGYIGLKLHRMDIHDIPGVVFDGRVELEVHRRDRNEKRRAVAGRVVEVEGLERAEMDVRRGWPELWDVGIEVEVTALVPRPGTP